MFLIRLGVLALIVLMVLPVPPPAHVPGAKQDAAGLGFCDRYPKTCDASGELLEALGHKLVYAAGWISRSAGVHIPGLSAPGGGRGDGAGTDPARTGQRYESWQREAPSRGWDDRDSRGTLRGDERSTVWPGAASRGDGYPGR